MLMVECQLIDDEVDEADHLKEEWIRLTLRIGNRQRLDSDIEDRLQVTIKHGGGDVEE